MISDTQIDPLFSSSEFIWAAGHGAARNQYVSFFREVTLGEDLDLTIHLFADTRYRLFVNEQFVAYGPGKFVTQFAEFDTFALAPYVSHGTNLIRVEVNFYGTTSFQSMPDGQPGFIAAGGLADGSISLATPSDWRARVHTAWSAEAVGFSFAQNPAEICDTRALLEEINSGADREVRVLEPYETPWNRLRARSVPYPTYQALEPAELVSAGPSAFDRDVYAVVSHHIDFLRFRYARGRGKRSMSRQFVSWIYSPEDQVVVVDSHWSKMALNGKILELDLATPLGNHGTYTFDLKQGWNGLSGAFGIAIEYDTFLLGWKKSAGLTMKALPNFEETAPWAWSPLMYERSIIPLPEAEKYEIPLGWVREDQDLYATAPARLMAWEQVDESEVIRDLPYHRLQEATTIRAKTAIWNHSHPIRPDGGDQG
ncbi:MAG: hypothetical protein MK080_12550 [Opitutales bacterium]|nr:hypothetical protein [Opitutales bacterium]NRA28048.1 hypothetical protein [Opitutales bacterium]